MELDDIYCYRTNSLFEIKSKHVTVTDDRICILCCERPLIFARTYSLHDALNFLKGGKLSFNSFNITCVIVLLLHVSRNARQMFKQKMYDALVKESDNWLMIIALNTAVYENDICVITKHIEVNNITRQETVIMKWKKIYENHTW